MNPPTGVLLLAILQGAFAHYRFTILTVSQESLESTKAIRQPQSINPVLDVASVDIRCNVNPPAATETVEVKAGDVVGFKLDNIIYHPGPAAFYLGKAPTTAAEWDGSGQRWFKFHEWGPTYNISYFEDLNLKRLNATIPANTPPGEYLLRAEQIGLIIEGEPQFYVSCAQIRVTGDGNGTPGPLVSIPGYIDPNNPNLLVNVFAPEFNVNKNFTNPGPAVWSG